MKSTFDQLQHMLSERFAELGVNRENLDFFITDLEVRDGGFCETENGFHFGALRYTGMIYVENMPNALQAWFAVRVKAWLLDYDETRSLQKLDPPKMDITDLGSGRCDIICAIDFHDEIYFSPAKVESSTTVQWQDKGWSIDIPYLIDVAESVADVIASPGGEL